MTSDVQYYRRRALAERSLAESAERADVAEIHRELARQYEALIARAELRPTLRIIVPGAAVSAACAQGTDSRD